jgi:hypothetical protein
MFATAAVLAPFAFVVTVAVVGGHDSKGRRRNFRESVRATFGAC